MIKVLWLSPIFNHYKARFLNHLARANTISLTIIAGTGREQMGDKELSDNWEFELIRIDASKKDFSRSHQLRKLLKSKFHEFDWIMIPAEKKNFPLLKFLRVQKKSHRSTRLFSYNHPVFKSKNPLLSVFDRSLTKLFYKKLDRVIFYSESSHNMALQLNLLEKPKAYWANNTIDSNEVSNHYNFELPPDNNLTILFIGRLIPSKKVDELFSYYNALRERHFKELRMEIIGDGPDQDLVINRTNNDDKIVWHGTLVDEAKISPIMKRASMVFVPGLSGLSINHAFAYGRPYFTLAAKKHGPELSYISSEENGMVLQGSFNENVSTIAAFLQDRSTVERYCIKAFEKGRYLSISNWVEQLTTSLLSEQV